MSDDQRAPLLEKVYALAVVNMIAEQKVIEESRAKVRSLTAEIAARENNLRADACLLADALEVSYPATLTWASEKEEETGALRTLMVKPRGESYPRILEAHSSTTLGRVFGMTFGQGALDGHIAVIAEPLEEPSDKILSAAGDPVLREILLHVGLIEEDAETGEIRVKVDDGGDSLTAAIDSLNASIDALIGATRVVETEGEESGE